MKLDLPYLCVDYDRHGNRRTYARRNGRKLRLPPPTDAGFNEAYRQALVDLGEPPPTKQTLAREGTLGWLATKYCGGPEFAALDGLSQRRRRAIIESILGEPRKPGSTDLMRDCPLVALTPQHIIMLRERKAREGLPAAANNRRKWLSAMFGWAVEHGLMKVNPCRDTRRVRYSTDGWHTWTADEVKQYEARHPPGTKARLALALLLLLGVRRGDLTRLGRQHCKDGWIRFVPRKTRKSRPRVSEKPILPALKQVIDASAAAGVCGDLTFLVTRKGNPFTPAGFGMWFKDRCREAGLPHCSAHGLRKAGATMAAENGATAAQLMALYDWDTIAMASVYTKQVDKRRLAGQAARKIHRR